MTIEERKTHFIKLGNFLGHFKENPQEMSTIEPEYQSFYNKLDQNISAAVHHNGWFTRENVIFALQQWHKALQENQLNQWLSAYKIEAIKPKTIGIVMAGNIPMVGFHDFLSVLMAGHKALVRQSASDKLLLPVIAEFLIHLDESYADLIEFTDKKLENFDAVIATGSDNTARYFEYYFSKVPNIIRKNRNSVAVLSGEETEKELKPLGEDIFRYYGLGCRNVSKLYVPKDYDFDTFFKAIYPWNPILNKAKYANNYDYNKAVYLMSEYKLLENGFLILKQDKSFGSPIATLFYEFYENESELQEQLQAQAGKLQCVVKKNPEENEVAFGKTQHPDLWDYADGVDTMKFLLNI